MRYGCKTFEVEPAFPLHFPPGNLHENDTLFPVLHFCRQYSAETSIGLGGMRQKASSSWTEPKAGNCDGIGRSCYLLSTSSSWSFIDHFYGVFTCSFISFLLLSLIFSFSFFEFTLFLVLLLTS